MLQVAFIDVHNIAPHLETAFELAKRHLDAGDRVDYHFLGHELPFREFMAYSRPESRLFRRWMPERRAARMIQHPALRFRSDGRLDTERYRVPAPTTLEALKAWTYDGVDIGMGVASSLISRTGNSRFDPARNRRMVSDALTGSVALYEYCLSLLENERPDLLYVFNGRLCHTRAILRAAERLGVQVRIHDRGATKDKFVARPFVPHDRLALQREVVAAWEDAGADKYERAHEWFTERREGRPKDWWSFTEKQRRGLVPDLPHDKRIVTYFSSSDDEFAALGDLFRWEGWGDQMNAVSELIRVAGDLPNVQLVIRLHPHLLKKHPDDMERWLKLARKNGTAVVIEPGSAVDSYSLVEASDVVITGGSTIGLEAVYWGRPSILMGPSEYDTLGAVNVATDERELGRLLSEPELSVDPASALPYGFYRGTFGEEFKFYAASTLREGEFLGVDLQRLPLAGRVLNRGKEALLGVLRTFRSRAVPELSR